MGRKENNPENLEISMEVILRGALRVLLKNSGAVSTSRRWEVFMSCAGECILAELVRECQDIQN